MNKASDEKICPDCGGRTDGAEGYQRCRCATKKPGSVGSSTSGPAPHLHGAPVAKLCRVCGKDLTNRSRLRDDYGYICKPCADKEDAGEITRPTGPKPRKKGSIEDLLADDRLIKCPECNRKLKPAGMVAYRGTLICKSCKNFHDETDGLKVGKVSLKGHEDHDREQIKKLAIIAAVLLLIGLGNVIYYLFIR